MLSRPVYQEFLPDARLRPYIKCYWMMEKDYAPGETEHVLPESCFELMYQHGARYRFEGAELAELFIVGQLRKPLTLRGAPKLQQWCVRFWPWGSRRSAK